MTGGAAGIGCVAYVDDELLLRGNLPVGSATNHQAELRAAAFALNSIPEGQDVELFSDSEYVVRTSTSTSRGGASAGGATAAEAPSPTTPCGRSSSAPSSATAASASSGRRGTRAPR